MNINLNIALHGYGAGESKIYRAGWRAGEPGKTTVAILDLKVVRRQRCLFFKGSQSLLLMPAADYMRPTYILTGNQLYPRSIDLNVNHI